MAKRGPKPKPKSIVQPGPLPDPPDWLDSPRALEFWERYGPVLNKLGLLESLDAVAFGMLCDAFSALLHMQDEFAGQELTNYVGEHGAEQQHPLIAVIRNQTKAIRELLSEFGMTPSSRTALTGSTSTTPTEAEVDVLEELARQMNESPAGPTRPATPARRKKAAKKKPARKSPAKKRATKKKPAKKAARKRKRPA